VADPGTDVTVRTRRGLQQVAVHVLARRRHAVTGRFGLRPAPGGFVMPLFDGDGTGAGEVVRVTGATIVVERGGAARAEPLTTLGRAADLVGVDLAGRFSAGDETPALADPDGPLEIDAEAALGLGAWWALGAALIDEVVATTPALTAATVAQLWPEHFDHGNSVTLAGDVSANLGVSPGDAAEPVPYLYVAPWSADRPGDPAYWNVPFGAVLRRTDLGGLPAPEARARALAFVRRGLDLLAAGPVGA
jgi:hypothetical protein